jgi:hypothetical protein
VKRTTTRLILSEVSKALKEVKSFEEVLNISYHWTDELNQSIKIYNETIKYVTGDLFFLNLILSEYLFF